MEEVTVRFQVGDRVVPRVLLELYIARDIDLVFSTGETIPCRLIRDKFTADESTLTLQVIPWGTPIHEWQVRDQKINEWDRLELTVRDSRKEDEYMLVGLKKPSSFS